MLHSINTISLINYILSLGIDVNAINLEDISPIFYVRIEAALNLLISSVRLNIIDLQSYTPGTFNIVIDDILINNL